MRQIKATAVLLVILTIVFSGSDAYSHGDSASSLRSKVEKFDHSLLNSQYGNIWDMMTADFKARVSKQDYVSYIRRVLGVTVTVKYSKFAAIAIYNDSVAISQHVLNLKVDQRTFGTIVCQAVIWERSSGEWQISQIFSCENEKLIFNNID